MNGISKFTKLLFTRNTQKIISYLLKGALVGFSLGLALAVGAASWLWLEMRVNVGLLIPVATILCAFFSLWRRRAFSYGAFLIAQILLGSALLVAYGTDAGALWSMPVYLCREGFQCTGLTRGVAALIFGGILLGGNLLWIALSVKRTPREESSAIIHSEPLSGQ